MVEHEKSSCYGNLLDYERLCYEELGRAKQMVRDHDCEETVSTRRGRRPRARRWWRRVRRREVRQVHRLCRDPYVNGQEMKYFECAEIEALDVGAVTVDSETLMRRHRGETAIAARLRVYPPMILIIAVWRRCTPNSSDAGGSFARLLCKVPGEEPGGREARLRNERQDCQEENFHAIQTSEWKQKHMMKLHNMVETSEAPRSMREDHVLDHVLDQELDQLIESEDVEKFRNLELAVDNDTKVHHDDKEVGSTTTTLMKIRETSLRMIRENLESDVDSDTEVHLTPVVEICETENDIPKENSELAVISYPAKKVRGPETRRMRSAE